MGIGRRNFLKLAGAACAPVRLMAGAQSGRRLAMVVDLRKCREKKDCSLCIAACHRTHNVPEIGNAKDEVKWIWKEPVVNVFPDEMHDFQDERLRGGPAPVLCNHCDAPPCVGVCPTGATWRRAQDGIVMMDWHRCIGCRYCMAACPYGSRSFNWRDPRPFLKEVNPGFPTRTRGVVEKCNFCEERLAAGEAPACVKACPAGAMAFGDMGDPTSLPRQWLRINTTIRRKAALGTRPQVYYIV